MDKKTKKIIIGVAAGIVVIAAIFFAVFVIPVLSIKDGQILSGVHLGPIDVSNCTNEEAAEKIEEYFKDYNKGKITIKAGSEEKVYDLADLKLSLDNEAVIKSAMDVGRTGGLFERYNAIKKLENETITVDIEINVDENAVGKILKAFSDEYGSEVVEPTMTRTGGKFVITEGKPGIVVDIDKSKEAIKEYLTKEWLSEKKVVEIVAEVKEPKGKAEDLAKIKDVLGTFSTETMGNENRVHNMKVGTDYINGSIVYPGETFSAVEAMKDGGGAAVGYKLSATYVNGKTVQDYGGGICQVATTLYNAAILSELEIVERHEHQLTVIYVPYSMDAAVAAGSVDLKIKNNTDYPIYIEGLMGARCVMTIYGVESRPSTRKVVFESEKLSDVPAEDTFEFVDSEPLGFFETVVDSHNAIKAQAWKVVYENGQQVSRTLLNKSSYALSNGVFKVGTKGASEATLAALKKAAETKKEADMRAVVVNATQNSGNAASEEKPAESGTGSEKPQQ